MDQKVSGQDSLMGTAMRKRIRAQVHFWTDQWTNQQKRPLNKYQVHKDIEEWNIT